MEFQGTLFTYFEPSRLTAFESGAIDSPHTLVFIGGLGDGYNSVPFLPAVHDALMSKNWSLVQVQLSSSYTGYGICTLSQDCQELDHLVRHLRDVRGKTKIVFMGHSTGSQDCFWHNRYSQWPVDGYILQAAVSDREHFVHEMGDAFAPAFALAEEMKQKGSGQELMPRTICEVPMTAERFYSLTAFGGDDDVFSTDFDDAMLEKLYRKMRKPMAMILADDEECYHGQVSVKEHLARLQDACPAIKKIAVPKTGGHCGTTTEAQQVICATMLEFIDNYVLA